MISLDWLCGIILLSMTTLKGALNATPSINSRGSLSPPLWFALALGGGVLLMPPVHRRDHLTAYFSAPKSRSALSHGTDHHVGKDIPVAPACHLCTAQLAIVDSTWNLSTQIDHELTMRIILSGPTEWLSDIYFLTTCRWRKIAFTRMFLSIPVDS